MDRIDKFLTHNIWLVVIFWLLAYYIAGALIAIMVTVITLSVWACIVVGNPRDVIAIIHYHDGRVEKHGIFPKYSDFEIWRREQMLEHSDLINYISYELYIEEKE